MARDTNYTLLVDGQPKRLHADLKHLQLIAADYVSANAREGGVEQILTIRCPQFGGSGGQAAVLRFDTTTQAWVKQVNTR